MSAAEVIEVLAIVLGAGLVAELVADRLRLPRMILLLALGAAVGPAGVDWVDVPLDAVGVQLLLTLGVSFILFHGGLELSLRILSPVVAGLALLAVPGVLITCAVAGSAAALAFGVPLEAGLLIGAVLAPMDPAILIPLFERLKIRPKLAQTIVAESALNDATGAVLALALASYILGDNESLAAPFEEFVVELGISTVLGVALGLLVAATISTRQWGIWRDSSTIAVLLVVAAGYVSIDHAGGSGYLGAFIAGLIVGNMETLGLRRDSRRADETRFFLSTASDVAVIFVFVLLGANLPFDAMSENAVAAAVTLAVLIFVARPLTILACLLPDRRGRWERNELLFMAWTRETGVIPAALVGVLIAEGIPYEDELLSVVALAIIVTLLLQSTSKGWLARRLGLDDAMSADNPAR